MMKREYNEISDDEEGMMTIKTSRASTPSPESPSKKKAKGKGEGKGGSPSEPPSPSKVKQIKSVSPYSPTPQSLVFGPGENQSTIHSGRIQMGGLLMVIPQRWTPEEDEMLIKLMEKVLKAHLWTEVEGPNGDERLVARTSYGVGYHALMLVSHRLHLFRYTYRWRVINQPVEAGNWETSSYSWAT